MTRFVWRTSHWLTRRRTMEASWMLKELVLRMEPSRTMVTLRNWTLLPPSLGMLVSSVVGILREITRYSSFTFTGELTTPRALNTLLMGKCFPWSFILYTKRLENLTFFLFQEDFLSPDSSLRLPLMTTLLLSLLLMS